MTLNTQDNSMIENFHKSIYMYFYYESIKAAVDEKEETIWHAMNFGADIVYFQNDLNDFSLIGGMRIAKIKNLFSRVQNIQIFENIVVI